MEYYVATGGNDGNSGTSSSKPWASMGQAAARARAGDVVTFADGTYQAGNSDTFANSGTAQDPITFKSQNPGKAVLKYGSGTSTKWLIQNAGYLHFSGLVLDGGGGSSGGQAVRMTNAHHITFEDCTIQNTAGHGVRALGGSISDLLFEGCTISPNVPPEGVRDGINVYGSDGAIESVIVRGCTIRNTSHVGVNVLNVRGLLVEGCQFEDTGTHAIGLRTDVADAVIRSNAIHGVVRGNGIYLEDDGQRNVTISDNLIWNCAQAGLYLRDNVAGPITVRHNTFYNNSMVDRTYGTVRAYNVVSSSPQVVFENNIIYSRGEMAINILDGVAADGFRFDYNLLFSEASQGVRWTSKSYSSFQSYQQSGNEPHSLMQRDPLFADTATFELRATSPAIGAAADGADIGVRARISPLLPKPKLMGPVDGTQASPGSVEFTWSAVEGATGYELRLGGQVHATPETFMSSSLAVGSYSWAVQAVDGGGNASGYTDPWSLTVVTILPQKPALLRPADGAAVDTASVEFAWNDVGAATYQLRVDGMVYTSAGTSTTQTLADGVHSWAVQAQAEDGSVSGYTAPRTLTVKTRLQVKVLKLDLTLVDENGQSYGPFTCELELQA
jgi:parallel beta-helix repeat protein